MPCVRQWLKLQVAKSKLAGIDLVADGEDEESELLLYDDDEMPHVAKESETDKSEAEVVSERQLL